MKRIAWILALALSAAPALADEKDACVDASTAGQRLRDENKLKEARDRFLFCAREQCPGVVKSACVEWLAEVDKKLPSVVVRAQDATGHDVVDVRVSLDGQLVSEKLDGKAMPVDPGQHVFRFERAGSPPVEERIFVVEGEKSRVLLAKFPGAATATPVTDEPRAGSSSTGRVPPLAWVLGGVGVVGLAGFGFFGLTAQSELDNLRKTCAPGCAESDKDDVKSKALIADVALGVGILALGAAVVITLTRPSQPPVTVGIRPVSGGLMTGLAARF